MGETGRFLLSSPLLNIILEALVREIKQEKETKGVLLRKEEKMFFTHDMIVYIIRKKTKESTKKLLALKS